MPKILQAFLIINFSMILGFIEYGVSAFQAGNRNSNPLWDVTDIPRDISQRPMSLSDSQKEVSCELERNIWMSKILLTSDNAAC